MFPTRDTPGYAGFHVEPCCPPGLDVVSCELDTVRGPIRSAWRRETDRLYVELRVPPGSTATLRLPWENRQRTLGPGRHEFTGATDADD